MKSIGLFWNSKQVIGGQVLECPYSEDCDKAKIVSSQNVQEKFEDFCIIPWIKMLNYTSISTKLS